LVFLLFHFGIINRKIKKDYNKLFLANSRNLVTNLSTDHIIALTFFCFFLLSLTVATILFFIYRQQVKKAYAIDQLIEIIYRHPAYKMLL